MLLAYPMPVLRVDCCFDVCVTISVLSSAVVSCVCAGIRDPSRLDPSVHAVVCQFRPWFVSPQCLARL